MTPTTILGLDRWSFAAFRRIKVRLALAFLAASLPIIAAAGPIVEGVVKRDPDTLLLAVVAVIASIVTLLGAIVAMIKGWVARAEKRGPRSDYNSELDVSSTRLIAANAVAISKLTADLALLRDTVRGNSERIDTARKTAESNLGEILRAMERYHRENVEGQAAIGREQKALEARLVGIEQHFLGGA